MVVVVLVVVFVTVLSPTYFGGPEIVSPLVEDIERVIVEDIDGYHDFAPPPPASYILYLLQLYSE